MTTDDATIVPPELNGVLLVHATLRQGADDLYAATERFGETTNDPAGLVRLWGFYAGGLRRHHQGEDDVIYPLVLRREPDFADVESDMPVRTSPSISSGPAPTRPAPAKRTRSSASSTKRS
jgi:hypothetical protein